MVENEEVGTILMSYMKLDKYINVMESVSQKVIVVFPNQSLTRLMFERENSNMIRTAPVLLNYKWLSVWSYLMISILQLRSSVNVVWNKVGTLIFTYKEILKSGSGKYISNEA